MNNDFFHLKKLFCGIIFLQVHTTHLHPYLLILITAMIIQEYNLIEIVT